MRTDCRICHSTRLDLILPLRPTPIGDEFLRVPREQPVHPIDLYQCADCGLAQLLYEIPPEEIYKDYIYLTGSSSGLNAHFAQYAKDVTRVCDAEYGDLVVDIGSNDGTLLRHFKALGMEVLGVEPAASIAKASNDAGIPTHGSYFRKGLIKSGSAKIITANNVVANINDLDSFMDGVIDLLSLDGSFVFESFYLGDVVKNMVFDFIYHEHLSAFSVKPVKRLMERYGLQLYRVDHLQTKGGSIRYYCNRYYAGRRPPVPDDAPELYEASTYDSFRSRIDHARSQTAAFCMQEKEAGKTIAAFGACISGTTLLYHFGLGDAISYLVDDNPAKIGTYSPGLHLPVYSPEVLAEKRPDYVLALAWRFADGFRAKYPGHKVIIPLPEFRCSPS